MNQQPLVSVLVRTKDRKELLRETLDSILAQTWSPVEVVIVNDGGEDFSSEMASREGSNIRWVNNIYEHGRSHAANFALSEATGEYCLFLDDDDIIDPTHIEGLVSALQANPEFHIAYSAVRTMADGVPEESPSFAYPFDPVRLMVENYIPIHAVLFERKLASGRCRFDPAFDRFEDWDFWLQMAENNDFLFVDQCTATYRVASQSGFGAKETEVDAMDSYRLALYRKWIKRWPEERLLALFDRGREFPRIKVQEKTIAGLSDDIQQKLSFIADLNTKLEEKDQRILDQQATLRNKESSLQASIKETREALAESRTRQQHIQSLQEELQVVYNSRSWKLTRPLRAFTKLRYFLRTEGVIGVLKRMIIRLAPSGRKVREIRPQSPVSDQFTPLAFPEWDTPACSIVIPVYNKYQYTFHCLKSILEHTKDLSYEVIVVDDCSSDKTQEMLAGISGIRVIRNEENLGFINSCNAGAQAARGEFLVLLNNDTEVRDGWLGALRGTFRDFPDAGLVGARLVFANGTLQEAGGIVWQDGSAWNYGRGGNPNEPAYAYCRQADYCSGACLMIPLEDFRDFGGFDTRYLPAYYEDTDLAFKVRQAGRKVYYQPRATIIHFEGVTSGTDTGSGIKKYQEVNHGKFFERWQEALRDHRPNGTLPELEKERHVQKRILVIDARVLMPDHDSGSLRMFSILRILMELGYKVTFLPSNLHYHKKYTPMMQGIGIECLYVPFIKDAGSYLENHGHQFDAVILSRADYAEKYIDKVKTHCPDARVLFDTVDLHFLREEREAELTGDKAIRESAAMRKAQELSIARKADVTLVVSPVELELFASEAPDVNVSLLSNIHENFAAGKAFSERRDILFIGNFEHPPNTDAMVFFLDEIFPLVQAENPDIRLLVVGGHVPSQLKARESDRVKFTGFVPDITPLFDSIRLSIAPLRFGAGVKGKINSSMAYGVPAVVSTIAAEGMNLVHGKDILVADNPEDFAREILRLYEDEALWQTLADAGRQNIEEHFSFAAAKRQLRSVLD